MAEKSGFDSLILFSSTLFVLGLAVAFGAHRLITRCVPPRRWTYRVALAVGAAAGAVASFVPEVLGVSGPALLGCLAGWLGAFAAGLATTAVDVGLAEDSFPPSPALAREVQRLHHRYGGRPLPEPVSKRLFDIAFSAMGLVLLLPLWIPISLLIWLEDPGPLFFVKNSVGRGGITFRQFKFRTMVCHAERDTGPVCASQGDPRILAVGRILRQLALDESPQLINILKGDMSIVGPRPLRTVVVHGYLQQMPEFAMRHRVLPGIAGLSQVVAGYYVTPPDRLACDRQYIDLLHTLGLRYDLQILLQAFSVVLHKGAGKALG